MPLYFLDSSALAKAYIAETGSRWVASSIDPSAVNPLHAARISGIEVMAAISRRVRGGSLTTEGGRLASSQFRSDFAALQDLVDVIPALINTAMDLAEKHGLRGYDAVQLAAAIMVKDQGRKLGLAVTLVSADDDLNAAAAVEGLQVENPNLHP